MATITTLRENYFRVSRPTTSLGYEQVTGLSSAKALTVPTGALMALVQAESQSVRFRSDGTNPTSSVGFILDVGAVIEIDVTLSTFKFIETAASAKLNVEYYK